MEKKSEKPEKLSLLLKFVLIDWCGDTSTHGLINIVKAQNIILRLIWIDCLLGSSGVCCYMIASSTGNDHHIGRGRIACHFSNRLHVLPQLGLDRR